MRIESATGRLQADILQRHNFLVVKKYKSLPIGLNVSLLPQAVETKNPGALFEYRSIGSSRFRLAENEIWLPNYWE
jgi:hypothetical protein